ncbi:hypothetical protein [Hyalangium versicolor]|uniref:hypothetical protein n=1 Tax=Hyalangium versicolor TaxID=2861190 RepID=UPI001CC9369C|nr:hypothetical protein [Hyalangium versicolor]
MLAAEPSKNPLYQEALRLYDAFEYETALHRLEQAAQWPSNTREDQVAIALLQGVLALEVQQPERGKNAFRHALSLAPDAQLSFSVSPKVAAVLEQIRAEVRRPTAVVPPPSPPQQEARTELPPPSPPSLETSGVSKLRLPVAIGGGIVALGGLIMWGKARSIESRIGDGDPSIVTRADMDDTLHQGKTFETVGWLLMGAGALTATGSLLFLDKPNPGPRVSVAPLHEGVFLASEWSLP